MQEQDVRTSCVIGLATCTVICDECFEELCSKGVSTDVEEFMNSEPSRDLMGATRNFFDTVFPRQE